VTSLGYAARAPVFKVGGDQAQHIQKLLETLPPQSIWRNLLKQGMTGNGTHYPWMDKMQKQWVKLAEISVEFTWRNRGKQLSNWRVVSVQFCRDYECRESISDHDVLASIDGGLSHDLQKAAIARAKIGNWIELPESEQGTGYRVISLADNEWLPVNLPPLYGKYDPGTTQLMHAALLGDVGRIEKLISQGEDVNATTKDGTTALIYASTSDNPLALEHLLRAGAKVDANMKGGPSASTRCPIACGLSIHREKSLQRVSSCLPSIQILLPNVPGNSTIISAATADQSLS
jgi:hypothetical protein